MIGALRKLFLSRPLVLPVGKQGCSGLETLPPLTGITILYIKTKKPPLISEGFCSPNGITV